MNVPHPARELISAAQTAYREACDVAGYRLDIREPVEFCQALNLIGPVACDALDRAVSLFGADLVMQ